MIYVVKYERGFSDKTSTLRYTYGFAEDGVSVAGDDLPTVEGGPDVLLDGLIGGVLADLLDHLLYP